MSQIGMQMNSAHSWVPLTCLDSSKVKKKEKVNKRVEHRALRNSKDYAWLEWKSFNDRWLQTIIQIGVDPGKSRTAQTNTGAQFLNTETMADGVKSRRWVKQYILIVEGKVDGMAWHGSLAAMISTVCRLGRSVPIIKGQMVLELLRSNALDGLSKKRNSVLHGQDQTFLVKQLQDRAWKLPGTHLTISNNFLWR